MVIPSWLKSYLNKEDIKSVVEAVKKAELKTSCEILPMIVRSSSTTGHVSLTLFFIVLSGWLYFSEAILNILPFEFSYGLEIALFMFLSWLLSFFLSRCQLLQRALISPIDQESQVYRRAEVEFYQSGVHRTNDQAGVLIFISILERRVVVLADKKIANLIEPNFWDKEVQLIVSSVKKKKLGEGLANAVEMCGERLSEPFPVSKDDINELKDEVIIKE